MPLMVTIPLEEYIERVIRSGQYAVINHIERDVIIAAGDYSGLCVIENEPGTYDFQQRPLPELSAGLWRLWYRKDWELNDNRRRTAVARIEAAEAVHREKIAFIIAHFQKSGIPQAIGETMVKGMSMDVINTTWLSLQLPTTQQQ